MTEERDVRVGARLRALRENQGWTPEAFGEALGIARTTLVNIEAGRKRLTPTRAHRASEVLEVPLAAIVSPAAEFAAAHPSARSPEADTDSTVIDLGDAGTIEITLGLRLFQMDRADLNEVLEKLSELKDLGERIAARSATATSDSEHAKHEDPSGNSANTADHVEQR